MNRVKTCIGFREMLKKGCLQVPGAFNGMVGRLIANNGFPACYISGAAVTASFGVPDIGLLTLDHFTNKIKEVSLASNLPIIADADTGFGEAEMVYRSVFEYFNAGACGKLKRTSFRRSGIS
jgi:methylisocitrate lyase